MRLQLAQAEFEIWWAKLSRAKRAWALLVMLLLPAATLYAFAVMGPRLANEGSLLWFGAYAEGAVRRAIVEEAGKFKGGAPKYRLTVDYEFPTPSGRRHVGSTMRWDLRDPPDLKPGDAIGVYYRQATPDRSVADYNLRTDVYALALFLPFLAVFGLALPGWYAWLGLRAFWQPQGRGAP